MIWFKPPTIETINHYSANTLSETLHIQITELGHDFIKGNMPVHQRIHQPYGMLHGGASVALAETLGSLGAFLTVDPELYMTLGMEINANHIKSLRTGIVTGTASPLHRGKSTQIWSIQICDEHHELVCVSRLTVAVRPIASTKNFMQK